MTHSILVVDDEQAICTLLSSILLDGGYQVKTAENVAEAKLLLAKLPFDLVITDLNMPDESGLDLIEHIKSQDIRLAVVMATIMDNPIEASRILEAGVYGYIIKPFNRNLVLITVANALRRHQLEMIELASRKSLEMKLHTITENVHVGLLLLDSQLNIIEENSKVAHWFIHPNGGKEFFLDCNCLNSEIDQPCSDSIRDAILRDEVLQYKARYLTRLGPIDFHLSLIPVADNVNGNGLVLMLEDLTEHLTMERELRQAQKLEAIGQLAAGITHEINTPVQYLGDNIRFIGDGLGDLDLFFAGVEAVQQTLAETPGMEHLGAQLLNLADQADLEYLREEMPKTVSQSLEGVARITSIIKAMKEFSHPGTSEKVATDINHCLESTITVSRNEWKYMADLSSDFDPELPQIPCFAGELNQVFLNLIINASHAISARVQHGHYSKGQIRVVTKAVDNGALITISDNGGGIPEGIQHRIFDPFFTTKGIGKGTGQGLSIARSIVIDKHSGKLTFNSIAGEGTTFSIFLPQSPSDTPGHEG